MSPDPRSLPTGRLYAPISDTGTPCTGPANTRIPCAGCPTRELGPESALRQAPAADMWAGLTAAEFRLHQEEAA